MPLRNTIPVLIYAAVWCTLLAAPAASASFTNFNAWSKVEDPPHAGLSGLVTSASAVTLSASGAIPSGTDIGYQSVNSNTVSSAGSGYSFSAASDFRIAVDFALSFSGSLGAGGIGFGIGEDGVGVDSAGIGIGFANGTPLAVSGAARVGDNTQTPQLLDSAAVTGSGRFFIGYDSASGNVDFGISATPGSAAPDHSGTLVGIQDQWNDEALLVSLFLRSEQVGIIPALSAGTVDAVFSNFAILEGVPQIVAVPLPAAFWLMGVALVGLGVMRRR